MTRRLTASALFVLAMLALTAAGQPPAPDKKPADKKAADPVDALIAAALANDPEVRIARAKVMLADAELAKARQLVTQKVITLRAAIEEQRSAVKLAEAAYALVEQRMRAGAAPQSEVLEARAKLETAKAKLAQLETELKLITGGGPGGVGAGPGAAAAGWDDLAGIHRNAVWGQSCLACHAVPVGHGTGGPAAKAVAGPVPDRIRAALDKKVKLGAKGEDVTFDQALEVFKKDAGMDVPVRKLMNLRPIKSEGEELPVGAWLQMYTDFNAPTVIVVREYGLLVTAEPMGIPPGAPTITEFWKTKPTAATSLGKRHEYTRDKLSGPIKVKAGDTIVVTEAVAPGDVEDAKAGSDNPAVSVRVAGNARVEIIIRANNPGKAKVTWSITTLDGRLFKHDGLNVEFE